MRVHRSGALLLLALLPALAGASISPVAPAGAVSTASIQPGTPVGSVPQSAVTTENIAIATAAEAAVAAGRPARWLVSFRVPEQQIEVQASAVATAAGPELPVRQAAAIARQQVYAAVKSSVLKAAAAPTSATATSTDAIVTEAGSAQAQPSLAVVTDYSHMPITLVSISDAAELARLRANPYVASVSADGVVRTMAMNGLELIGQPAAQQLGYIGAGSVVIVDTGLEYTRSAFGPCTAPGVPAATCKVAYMQDFAADDSALDSDAQKHGTNVAGIISTVAPGVKLISLDVFGTNGQGKWSDLINAVNWAVSNKDVYNITSINLSLGGGNVEGACDDNELAIAVNTAYAQGVLSAAASGNEAQVSSMITPACASKAVSVGAVYSKEGLAGSYEICTDNVPAADIVACFSNSAPLLTILAPGASIQAADITLSGTSQATPFVSAAIAILRTQFPTLTIQQVVDRLTSTGVKVTDPRNGLEKPRLDLSAALGITGTPSPSPSPSPRPVPPPVPSPSPPVGNTCSSAPRASPSSIRAATTGGTYSLTVVPPSPDCTWTLVLPTASWVRVVSPTTQTLTGTQTVTLQVDQVVAEARSSGISFTSGTWVSRIAISQAVTPASLGDERAPIMGRLQGTVGTGAIELNWPVASDLGGSGVSSYMVVYNQGSRPPGIRCTTGTQVTATPAQASGRMRVNVPGLTAGARYTFRVCAIDAAGNVAGGSMWRGTATNRR